MRLRSITALFVLSIVAISAPASAGDKTSVVADCKTATVTARNGGIGLRIVADGAVPGLEMYVHELPPPGSKPMAAKFVGALQVKEQTIADDKAEFAIQPVDGASKFFLTINKEKTAGGDRTATLKATQLGGKQLAAQDMVCTLGNVDRTAGCEESAKATCATGTPTCSDNHWDCAQLVHGDVSQSECDVSKAPASCPGGGVTVCGKDKKWSCSAPPKCDPNAAARTAKCPGGGATQCVDGLWTCSGIPKAATCNEATKPAAGSCPGGGVVMCTAGTWSCGGNIVPLKK